MGIRKKAAKLLCSLLAATMCLSLAMPALSTYAVTNEKPVNPDGTTPNWNKPQDKTKDDQRQFDDMGVRLVVSKIKTSVGEHEGIAPKTTSAQQENTVTYKISGRVEGTKAALEEKYGTGNIEFAYSSAGIYLGYGWYKGTLEYLLNRKAASYPEDLSFDIIYNEGVFTGFAYVTRKLETTDNENRFVAGATMALYQAIEIERDNTITTDGLDVGEDHRFIGVEVTRNSDGTIDDIRVKKGHAGFVPVYVYQKDGEELISVDSYGFVVNKNYNPKDQINDLKEGGTWILKSVEREDTPILYYNLDNLRITSNDKYTDTTVDKVFGSERVNKDSILYGFDKKRNVINATQLNEIDFSIYGFVGDETKPSFEFVGGDFNEIKYSESEKRIVVGTDTLIYHLDSDGNRDSLVDPQTGIAYIEEKIDKKEGHDNIHHVNNTDTLSQQDTKIYVWPVNISYDGSGSTSGNKNGSKTFSKIMGTRIATINTDKEDEYVSGTYENEEFPHKLFPMQDLYGKTIYYKQSSEIFTKGEDTWDYDGDVYTGWKYTDILDAQNLDAYTINDHDTLYNGDADDPFDQSTHYQYSKTQSVKLKVDSNGYIVNGASTVPVPKKDNAGFKGWIVSNLDLLTDGTDIYPSWDSNPNKGMSDDVKNRWYSDREATGTVRTVTVTFHANSKGDGDDGAAEFVSGSGDIHSTDNKLYRKLGESFLIYDKWITGENTPNDPFDDTKVDTVENTATNVNTLTASGKTANDPYSVTMAGGMSDMLKHVALGDYILEELSSPLGYVKGLPVGVTVNYSSVVQKTEMEDKTIKLEMVKVDAPEIDLTDYKIYVDGELQTNAAGDAELRTEQKASFTYKEVTGAKFKITGTDDESKKALSSWALVTSHDRVTAKTGADGYSYIEVGLDTPLILEGFPKGNYLATEIATPNGAVTMEPKEFSVGEEDSIQFKGFSDDHIKVEVEKYYLDEDDTKKHLDNARKAELALIDSAGNTVSTWWTDDLSEYKNGGITENTSLLTSIINTVRNFFTSGENASFEESFSENFTEDKTITSIGWTVKKRAELLSGATDETQVWLISDGTKVTCSYRSAPDDAPAAFKEAYKDIDSTVTEFTYEDTLSAAKDTARSITDSDMYWNCSNGSVIHIAAYPDESSGKKKYTFEFQYNYKDLSGVSPNLISYDKEEGVHRFEYLPKGTYKIRELTAPDGFIKASDKEITVNETYDIQRFMYENKRRDLKIFKYGLVNGSYYAGNDSGNVLASDDINEAAVIYGFKFKVYYSENAVENYLTAFDNEALPLGVTLKDTFTTGTDGKYTEKDFKNNLITEDKIGDYKPHELKDVENGYYYIVETEAVSGYKPSKVKEVRVTDESAENALKVEIVNEVMPARVKVVKEDENGARLSGAGFNVINKTLGGTAIGYLETDSNGEGTLDIENPYTFNADGSLKVYTFEISEVKAPNGYTVTDKTYEFTADPSKTEGGVSLISISNGVITYVDEPTVISVSKADFDDPLLEVPGTKFRVYEANFDAATSTWSKTDITKEDWTWVTSKGHPEHQLNDLSAGKTYALVEEKVPDGYAYSETVFFTINNAGNAIEKVWTGNKDNHAITFNEAADGSIKSIDFKSRQALGATLIGKHIDTNETFELGLDNSGYVTLTKTELKNAGTYELDVKINYSDGTGDIIASTSVVAASDDESIKVKLPVTVDKTNGISYRLTDSDGNEIAKWSLDNTLSSSTYTVSNPLSGSEDHRLSYYNSTGNYVGIDSSSVFAKKNIAYQLTYYGDGVNDTEILIKPNDKTTITKIDNGSAAAYGPMDDGYYHITGSKDGGSLTFIAMVRAGATGFVTQNVTVNGRTLERINPIAVNKDSDAPLFRKIVIANEVNGTDPANDDAEFTYELTLTRDGTDSALTGEYDYRTRYTSGKFTSFGKVKTFTFTLKGNDFLVMDVSSDARYEVKQLSKEDGFTTTTAGNVTGTVSTDNNLISYASFKNERSIKQERTVFEKNKTYYLTETLTLSDNEKRELTKYGFSLNDNESTYNLIILNKQTEVWFSKTSWTDCEEVPGASCTLYEQDASGNWVPVVIEGVTLSWTSTTEPTKFKGTLTAGKTYRYVEVGPPEGYAYTEAIEFTVSDDGKIDKVVMRDKLTDVKFTKTNVLGESVSGASLSVKGYYVDEKPALSSVPGGEWKVIESWTSGSDNLTHPHEIKGKLTAGASYKYRETKAPDGFTRSADIAFNLDNGGHITNVHYVNDSDVTLIFDKDGFAIDDITAILDTDGNYQYYYYGELLSVRDNALYNGETLIEGTEGFGVNLSSVDDITLNMQNEEVVPLPNPGPEYEMEKERVSKAPEKYLYPGSYGFKRGETVTYKVTVKNTGAMQLTMDVTDNFDSDVASYFTTPVVTGVDLYDENKKQSAEAGKKNLIDGNKANVTIENGCYAVVTYTATVLDTAPEYLAPSEADDKSVRDDGYGNTATTTNVIAKYIDAKGVERTLTKRDYDGETDNPLRDKEDTADTPVQEDVDIPSYLLTKERVTPATVKEGVDGKYGFIAGEKAVYKVVCENTGETKLETTISDEFEEKIRTYFKDLKIEAPEGGVAVSFTDREGNADASKGDEIITEGYGIGTDKIRVHLEVGGRVEVYYSAVVSDTARELLSNAPDSATDPTGYLNIARAKETKVPKEPDVPSYPDLPDKEDEDHTPVQAPNPSYEMTKERITDATHKIDDKYGFKHGEEVSYLVTVTNTGDTVLTMNVDDKFNGDVAEYFSTPLITDVSFTDGSLVEVEGAGIGTDHAKITLNVGGIAKFTYTAKVLDTAPESLALHAADDGKGYLNTATVKDVTSTYKDKDGVEHTTTENDYPDDDDNPLKPKEDTANTPVQLPTPDYEMSKERVSEAPKKNSTKYGFYKKNTVTYEVTVTNTGNVDLKMLVNDAFETSIAGYFENLKITGIKFVDKSANAENAELGSLLTKDGTGIGTTKAYIDLKKTGKAIITYTADVSQSAKESLSNAAKDDGLGYLNTATTSEVVGTYEDPDGNIVTVTKDDFDTLKDKSDTANTPVQVTSSGGGGGGGGGGGEAYAKIVIYKYDEETSKPLSGATFEIYYPDGSLYKTVTTSAIGEASVKLNQTGTYTYKEIKAPDGYALDGETHELEVTNLATVTARVPNGKDNVTPPTPDEPSSPKEQVLKGKISVNYDISVDGDGNGWFDADGNFHKLPTPNKYKTGDTFNMVLLCIAALTGLMFIGIGVVGLKKKKKKK